ncbi:TrbI/VirB10 family protein [Streptobacillus moniliformis]|uniref:TrbI/VirB10 family protein n=1 Tax=Streptobacillus moniliformis TaxID=34105 RepID=UPI0007E4CAA7|nr:TrbI/VirB10 family protein [Streptobacillus moniliformis]
MAIFRLRYKCGKKALAHLSYINGEDRYISKKEHVEFIETKNLPENFKDINEFWTFATLYERSNANLYREFEITLPKEFTKEKNKEILDRFLEKTFGDKFVYNYAMHNPNEDQPHAHVMFCERELDGILRNKSNFFKRHNPKNPEKGGARKERKLHDKKYLLDLRKNWEIHLNKYLEASGLEKVSSDTLKKQREEAIEKGEILKAEKLDREAIHINKKIKQNRINKEDIDAYDLYERIKMHEYMKEKKIREKIDLLYKMKFIKKKYDDKKKEITRNRYKLNEEVENKVENIIDRKNKIASSFNDYLVQQGSVIPAIFLTEVNTDLPGSVLAQVRENVYDSRTGNYLLIPKGSKLYGRYESNVSKGQTRVFMVWDKLSLPNGKYIELSEFHAGDNLGNSGVSDKTNNHTWSLIGNAVLSSVLNFTDTLASGVSFNLGGLKIGLNGQSKDGKDTSPFKEVTSHLVKKEVERQPTITIRRGYKFNIIVNGDMELEKYKY